MKHCKKCGCTMSLCHSRYIGNCLPKKNIKMEGLYDYEILEMAMENTYNLIMGNTDLKELLDEGLDVMPFACDPNNLTKQGIENVLNYYKSEEEYEKCSKIQEYLKSFKENLED
jgi:hypothetical protein